VVADVHLVRIIIAGVVGAAAMVIATYLFHALGLPMVDFGRLLATKILRYHSHGTRLGLVLHLVNGVVLAVIYALLVDMIPGPGWLRGLGYGAVLWLVMMVVAMPALGDGFFGSRAPRGTVLSALVTHLVYGLILGLAVSK
jgi:uncharacterized membrane protein YagU involved in acid resistance